MLSEDLKNEIIKSLKSINLHKVILFGSYAYGSPTKDSDFDLLVITSDETMPKNYDENMQLYLKVSKCLREIKKKYPIDLIVHTRPMQQKFIELDSMFSRMIFSKGIVLYEDNDK